MTWSIRLLDRRPEHPEIGDMWPAPWWLDEAVRDKLSAEYNATTRAHRAPLIVRLPGDLDFCIDSRAWSGGKVYGDGWHPVGDPPRVTLNPSINFPGIYHGWIRDGVISDDCEGRTFPARST